jgi:hypothetical protein
MRFPIWLTLIAAVITLGLVLGVGQMLIWPERPLIASAGFSLETISPNADGIDDVTEFAYEITRNASVTVALEHPDGEQYYFRQDERRTAGEYQVLFSGVVDGYTLPGEDIGGEVLRRLIPDGEYTWRLRAVAQDDGEIAEVTGALSVVDADADLPEMIEFTVGPSEFSPNQDGVNDRVFINVVLTKDAGLTVYLVDEDGQRSYVARREEGRQAGEAGRHVFDYDGGVDIGADPPPDGDYTVVALARDDVGQEIRRTASLTIVDGGKPRAEIRGQPTGPTVVFVPQPYEERFFSSLDTGLGDLIEPPQGPETLRVGAVTVPLGDLLVFRLTVYNYGAAPIRTSGPPPGTVYEQTQRAASLGEYEQAGVWRVGIECETSELSYPWRWAIGTEDDLYTVIDPATGNEFSYLPPGAQSVVWGAVRLTEIRPTRNPQLCFAGLIHEQVEISLQNSFVDPREITIADTSPTTPAVLDE